MGYFIHGLRDGVRGSSGQSEGIGFYFAVEVDEPSQGGGVRATREEDRLDWFASLRFARFKWMEFYFSGHGCHNMVRAENNDWVYVKGAKESPDKGGTSLGPKQKPKTEN